MYLDVATCLKSSEHEHKAEAKDYDVCQPLPFWTHLVHYEEVIQKCKKKPNGENSTSVNRRSRYQRNGWYSSNVKALTATLSKKTFFSSDQTSFKKNLHSCFMYTHVTGHSC